MDKWNDEQLAVGREMYIMLFGQSRSNRIPGAGIPGTRNNVVIVAFGKTIGKSPSSVWARLNNYGTLNPLDTTRGFGNAGEAAKRIWAMKAGSSEYEKLVNSAFVKYPELRKILPRRHVRG
jgi:hypothetical protein